MSGLRPLLIEGRAVTDSAVVHCPEHGHESELVNEGPLAGWLLNGHAPDEEEETCLVWECPHVLVGQEVAPCDSAVVLDFAPEDDKTR